ncbi:MAG TPA: hypothetical protein DIW47_15465 [Bacteroidetes bacterium]|nr:hypothetical protein [Bacteroidota bacterium]
MNQKILEGDFSTKYKASAFFNTKRFTLLPFVKRYLLDSLTARSSCIPADGSDENRFDTKPMFFVIPLPAIKQAPDHEKVNINKDTDTASSISRIPYGKLEKRPIPPTNRSRSNFSNPKRMRRLLILISHIPSLFFASKRKAGT